MHYLIGVDLGTTNIKAVALAADGRLLAQAKRSPHTLAPFPGAAEQNPDRVFRQVVEVVREVAAQVGPKASPAGITFSGAMHSLFALDTSDRPIGNAWLWSDLRAAALAEAVQHTAPGLDLYRRTGTPLHAMSPLFKIEWMRLNQPDEFAQARCFLGLKDYVLRQILGEAVSDASVASATGLLNTVSSQWDDTALAVAGISAHQLPEVVSPTRVFRLPASSAALLGLPAGIPVLPGASDGALANLGSGVNGPEGLAITIGTSAALRLTLDHPALDARGRTFCYRLDDGRFIAGGASNNGSNVVDWLRRHIFRTRLAPDRLLAQAGQTDPGCAGLLFLPYLHGERAPLWNAQAVGVFHGLRAVHTREHLLRAAVEGVAYNLKAIAAALPQAAGVDWIAFSGGAAGSGVWRQVLADVFHQPVLVPSDDSVDASVLGAVQLAREALGWAPMPATGTTETRPQAAYAALYDDGFSRYAALLEKNGYSAGQLP